MDLIVTHERPDFDALASLSLAKRLHPGATVVLPPARPAAVQACLNLYADTLEATEAHDLDLAGLAEDGFALICVDTADASRVRLPVDPRSATRVWVYDHHPPLPHGADRLTGAGVVAPAGATVTLLTRELKRRNLTVTPEVASLALLGLHEDTGGFRYGRSENGGHASDHEAAAWLHAQGGTLALTERFLDAEPSEARTQLREALLKRLEIRHVAGHSVATAAVHAQQYVSDVAPFTDDAMRQTGADAVLLGVGMEDESHLFARARSGTFDLAAVARSVGRGGGHPEVGYARSSDAPDALVEAAVHALEAHATPAVRARDIASSPVRSVPPDTPVHDASRMLLDYGHHGLPVVQDGRAVGMLSRRDTDRALRLGLGRSPVSGFMRSPAVTMPASARAADVEAEMARRGLGRMPLTEDGRLVGIVTRSDLLRLRTRPTGSEADDLAADAEGDQGASKRVRARLQRQLGGLSHALKQATPDHATVYAVGGTVRDALLGVSLNDVDLLIDGAQAAAVLEAVAAQAGGRVTAHDRFGTASLTLPGGVAVDLAAAREESYDRPGALPEVEASEVGRDLARRDFTVNAMAVPITTTGPLVDPYGGLRDLQDGVLRVLHERSFIDDATRLVRGARLAARLSFAFEDATLDWAHTALDDPSVLGVTPARLRSELQLATLEPQAARTLHAMHDLGVLTRLYGLTGDLTWVDALETLQAEGFSVPQSAWLLALLMPLSETAREASAARFNWRKRLTAAAVAVADLAQASHADETALHRLGPAGRAVLAAASSELKNAVRAFDEGSGRRRVRGQDLLELGLEPGPLVGRILARIGEARQRGECVTFEDERALAQHLIEAAASRNRDDAAP